MRIAVTSREQAQSFNQFGKVFCVISIHTPGGTPNEFEKNFYRKEILRLCFDDFSDPRLDNLLRQNDSRIRLIRRKDAQAILDFVNFHTNYSSISDFLIHCDAGISRSPGVAVALNEIYNNDKEIPFAWRRYNSFVYRVIMDEYYRRMEKENGK